MKRCDKVKITIFIDRGVKTMSIRIYETMIETLLVVELTVSFIGWIILS